jgi:uncharacterized protein YyaL (SSP411 family)
VPHFEKMLYDNALLARTYLEAFQVTGDAAYRDVVTEVLDYIRREMTDPQGGFYSATDADSEGVEGKFFVWTPEEVARVLGNDEDARRLCACYDISAQGNWEHKSIPNRMRPLDDVARELNVTTDELKETMHRVRPLLYEARKQRVPPGVERHDDLGHGGSRSRLGPAGLFGCGTADRQFSVAGAPHGW